MGGAAFPLAVIGFSLLHAHKEPIEGGGEAAPRQRQLPPLFTAPQRATRAPSRQRGAGPASAKPQPGQAARGDRWAWAPPCLGTALGTPRTGPWVQPCLFTQQSESIQGDAPVVPVGAAHGHRCPCCRMRQKCHFPGLPPVTGQQDRPQPCCPLMPCPQQPWVHPMVPHPQHTGQGLCQLCFGSVSRSHGGCCSLKKQENRTGIAFPKCTAGCAWWWTESRVGAQGGLPALSILSWCPCVPHPHVLGGHLRVGDLGGFLGQAAALGRDQVVVLGHILIRVVEAAGAGPWWGPWEQRDAQCRSPPWGSATQG